MSQVTDQNNTQVFLQLVKRTYTQRDEITKSSKKLINYSHELEKCSENDMRNLLSNIQKEFIKIIANIHELSPHLKNPEITEIISEQIRFINLDIEQLAVATSFLIGLWKARVALQLRDTLCQDANKTELKPTPKSIRQAFGVKVSLKDLTLFYQHEQDNY
ncbi:MAG: hypothetical protein ACYDG5_04745 [Dehalococcoidales bacterium]